MDRRETISLLSLGIVAAGVGGIALTARSDEDGTAAPSDDASAPAPTDDSASSAADTGTDAETEPVEAPAATVDPNIPDLPNMGPRPEFLPVQEWLQTDATSLDDFAGKVLAVQFWTFWCHNCQATWPHMRNLHQTYAGEHFEIIGIHAPEFSYESEVENVAAAAIENDLVWPIAIDNEKANFRSWQERRFWPRLFLIDVDGNIRYDKIGEGRYDEQTAAVGALIAEATA